MYLVSSGYYGKWFPEGLYESLEDVYIDWEEETVLLFRNNNEYADYLRSHSAPENKILVVFVPIPDVR